VIPPDDWSAVPARVQLDGDEIHVVVVDLDEPPRPLDVLEATLATDERERAARFRFPRDARRFVAGRGLLRHMLGRYLGEEPERIVFTYGATGKPRLADGGAGPGFNISHSGSLALLAVGPCDRIGIDIERIRPVEDADQIATRCFSARERTTFSALDAAHRLDGFFNCWTRKEAFVKALGEGLTHALDRFDVSLTPGCPAELLRIDDGTLDAPPWTLDDLRPQAGYVGALAVPGRAWRVSRWHWAS